MLESPFLFVLAWILLLIEWICIHVLVITGQIYVRLCVIYSDKINGRRCLDSFECHTGRYIIDLKTLVKRGAEGPLRSTPAKLHSRNIGGMLCKLKKWRVLLSKVQTTYRMIVSGILITLWAPRSSPWSLCHLWSPGRCLLKYLDLSPPDSGMSLCRPEVRLKRAPKDLAALSWNLQGKENQHCE